MVGLKHEGEVCQCGRLVGEMLWEKLMKREMLGRRSGGC